MEERTDWLTVRQVADVLSASVRTVWRYAAQDESFPKPIKVGGLTRFNLQELTRWQKAQKTSCNVPCEAPRSSPSLEELKELYA